MLLNPPPGWGVFLPGEVLLPGETLSSCAPCSRSRGQSQAARSQPRRAPAFLPTLPLPSREHQWVQEPRAEVSEGLAGGTGRFACLSGEGFFLSFLRSCFPLQFCFSIFCTRLLKAHLFTGQTPSPRALPPDCCQ